MMRSRKKWPISKSAAKRLLRLLIHLLRSVFERGDDRRIEEVEEGICLDFLLNGSHGTFALVLLTLLYHLDRHVFSFLPVDFASVALDDLRSLETERVGFVGLCAHDVDLGQRPVGEKLVFGEEELELEAH